MTSAFQRLFVLILAGSPLLAELLHVELSVGGLDCISCAQSIDKILKKIKGVDAASFRTQDSVAVVGFKAGNSTTLDQIRDAVKGVGYTPKSAKLTARGQAREDGGKWILQVTGSGAEYVLDVSAVQPLAGAVVVEGLIAGPSAPFEVSAMRCE